MKKELLITAMAFSFISIGAYAAEDSAKQAPVGSTFKRLDVNGDGKIDAAEAQADPDLAGRFSEFDKNHDGVITPEEVQAYDEAAKAKRSGKSGK